MLTTATRILSTSVAATVRGSDWRRRNVRDSIGLLVVGLVAFAVSKWSGLFEKTIEISSKYVNLSVGEMLTVGVVLGVAAIVLRRRPRDDLTKEIKARQYAEMETLTLTHHDPLTGLPNRRFFTEKLAQVLQRTKADGKRTAVLVIGLDGFKAIRHAHGHAASDKVLEEFAERISCIIPLGAILFRIEDSSFAIIQTKVETIEDPTRLSRRIINIVTAPFVGAIVATSLGVNIGVAMAPQDGTDVDQLLQNANLALDVAVAAGAPGLQFFQPGLDVHMERLARIDHDLWGALATRSLVPHYQPLVDLKTDRIIGFEALARWNHPELGTIPPSVFIGIAEESGSIFELGDHLLRTACEDAMQWPADISLAFNISAVQLRDPSLGLRIMSMLAETGFDPHRLEVEITESALVGDTLIARRIIDGLRAAGVRIALDDFGTGYATMSQLLAFRFDKIKIDRSFISRLGKESHSMVIVRAIIGLANGLGLTTTAEGIEDSIQLINVKASGCSEGQGYLFGQAVPASEVLTLLQTPSRMSIAG